MNDRQTALAAHPAAIIKIDGRGYVPGDALFTHWMDRETGAQVTSWDVMDRLDRELLASRRAQ